MRESIGATWIFTICLTFIILMTAYLAISVNYAKAFKIKSYIVSEIEENEGYDGNLEQQIRNYLTAQGYTAYGTCDSTITVGGASTDWKRIATIDDAVPTGSDQHNACIYTRTVQTGNDDIDAKRSYYRVVVFFKFDLPVVNFLTTFKVGGETGYIYDTSSNAHRNPISTKGTAAPTTARPLTTTTKRKDAPPLREYIIERAKDPSSGYYDCVSHSTYCEKTSKGHLGMWPCQDYTSEFGTMTINACKAEIDRIYASLPARINK